MTLFASLLIALSLYAPADTLKLEIGMYIGELPSGEGKLYHNERGLFIGTFNRTVPSGRGINIRPDGSKYAGNFVKGTYQGYGRLFMATGAVICGEFSNGRANGRDTLFYPDGKVFIGVVQNNGATSQGKTYKNAQAAKVIKPVFPDIELNSDDLAFLDRIKPAEFDTPAVFKDGASFFQAYIYPNFRYTESMSSKTAVVHYEFVVGEDGKLRDIVITSSTDEDFSRELERVLKHCPRWTPATKDGKPVPYAVKNQEIVFGTQN